MSKFSDWGDELSLLEGQDRLTYLIDLARKPTNMPPELRTDDRLVNGCMSKIWIEVGQVDDKVIVYYDSDALITKGITSVICDCFSDITLAEAKQITVEDFQQLGITELLSAQRRNGLLSLIHTIQNKVQIL